MLCAMGAIVAAAAARRVADLAALIAGFAAAVILQSPAQLPDAVWIGVCSAGAALLVLFRPRLAWLASAWGGALGGTLTAMVTVQGLHPVLSILLVALTITATV